MNKITTNMRQFIVSPDILIMELSKIVKKNFLTESELFFATNVLRKRIKNEQLDIIFDITHYSIERTLRYNYRLFEMINDIIVVKETPEINVPESIRECIDSALENLWEE